MFRLLALIVMLATVQSVSAADRVVYVNRDVVEYYVGSDGKQKVRTVVARVATVVSDPIAAPVVAASRTFQSGGYHAGHNCPNCGQAQTKISNDNGPSHEHTCSNPECRTVWTHDDAVSAWKGLKMRFRR